MNRRDEQQHLLNISVAHILNQNGPSAYYTDDGRFLGCSYHSRTGKQCGAAPFIINYVPEMETKNWRYVADTFKNDVHPLAWKYRDFVARLQEIHDYSAMQSVNDFMKSYRQSVHDFCIGNGFAIPIGV